MFYELRELDKPVVDRIKDKIREQNISIEIEVGLVKNGMIKVLFCYKDYEVLNRIITDSINEEYELL